MRIPLPGSVLPPPPNSRRSGFLFSRLSSSVPVHLPGSILPAGARGDQVVAVAGARWLGSVCSSPKYQTLGAPAGVTDHLLARVTRQKGALQLRQRAGKIVFCGVISPCCPRVPARSCRHPAPARNSRPYRCRWNAPPTYPPDCSR